MAERRSSPPTMYSEYSFSRPRPPIGLLTMLILLPALVIALGNCSTVSVSSESLSSTLAHTTTAGRSSSDAAKKVARKEYISSLPAWSPATALSTILTSKPDLPDGSSTVWSRNPTILQPSRSSITSSPFVSTAQLPPSGVSPAMADSITSVLTTDRALTPLGKLSSSQKQPPAAVPDSVKSLSSVAPDPPSDSLTPSHIYLEPSQRPTQTGSADVLVSLQKTRNTEMSSDFTSEIIRPISYTSSPTVDVDTWHSFSDAGQPFSFIDLIEPKTSVKTSEVSLPLTVYVEPTASALAAASIITENGLTHSLESSFDSSVYIASVSHFPQYSPLSATPQLSSLFNSPLLSGTIMYSTNVAVKPFSSRILETLTFSSFEITSDNNSLVSTTLSPDSANVTISSSADSTENKPYSVDIAKNITEVFKNSSISVSNIPFLPSREPFTSEQNTFTSPEGLSSTDKNSVFITGDVTTNNQFTSSVGEVTASTTITTDNATNATTDNATNATTDYGINATTDLTTTMPISTTELVLNTSDLYDSYWVKTVLSVSLSEDIEDPKFIWEMESRFSALFEESLERERNQLLGRWYPARKVRAVQGPEGTATVQITQIRRPSGDSEPRTDFLYYLVEGEDPAQGNMTDAARTVHLIRQFHEHEVAIELGYVVLVVAEIYKPSPPPPESLLWIIGVVIGSLLGLLLIVWAILYIYFSCKRPRKKGTRSPRGKVSDPEMTDIKQKDVKGFDYARTEVGMENELGRSSENVKEDYMLKPYETGDATRVESTGETPPPKYGCQSAPVVRPLPGRGNPPPYTGSKPQENRVTSTSHEPQQSASLSALPGSSELCAVPHMSSRNVDPDTRTDREISGTETPVKSSRTSEVARARKPKRKGNKGDMPNRAGEFENLVRMSGVYESPEVEGHNVPAGARPSNRNTDQELLQNIQLNDSVQHKADVERWRNKQRMRVKRKGRLNEERSKSTEEEQHVGNRDDHPAELARQPRKKKRKPKKKKKVNASEHVTSESIEMSGLIASHANSKRILPITQGALYHRPVVGVIQSDSSSADENDEEDLEEAREKIHELVDNTFAMVAPHLQRRKRKVRPLKLRSKKTHPLLDRERNEWRGDGLVGRPGRWLCDSRLSLQSRQYSPEVVSEEEDRPSRAEAWASTEADRPKHTPIYVDRVRNQHAKPPTLWNPYGAADETARLNTSPEGQPEGRGAQPLKKYDLRPVSNGVPVGIGVPLPGIINHQYSNPAFSDEYSATPRSRSENGLYAAEPADPIKISVDTPSPKRPSDDYISLSPNYKPDSVDNITQKSSLRTNDLAKFRGYSPASRDDRDADRTRSGHALEHSVRPYAKVAGHRTPSKRSDSAAPLKDDDDIILKTGASAEPLINSIRQDLARLGSKSGSPRTVSELQRTS